MLCLATAAGSGCLRARCVHGHTLATGPVLSGGAFLIVRVREGVRTDGGVLNWSARTVRETPANRVVKGALQPKVT